MRLRLCAVVLLLAAVPMAAHEKFKIVGTVVKVGRAELTPGTKVTVHALGHDLFDLEVTEIHITD